MSRCVCVCVCVCVCEMSQTQKRADVEVLTVNSPVTESKPTWMVCSKSEGEEISGLSLSRSFFLPPAGEKGQGSTCW